MSVTVPALLKKIETLNARIDRLEKAASRNSGGTVSNALYLPNGQILTVADQQDFIQLGQDGLQNLGLGDHGIQSRKGGSPTVVGINEHGGGVQVGGNWSGMPLHQGSWTGGLPVPTWSGPEGYTESPNLFKMGVATGNTYLSAIVESATAQNYGGEYGWRWNINTDISEWITVFLSSLIGDLNTTQQFSAGWVKKFYGEYDTSDGWIRFGSYPDVKITNIESLGDNKTKYTGQGFLYANQAGSVQVKLGRTTGVMNNGSSVEMFQVQLVQSPTLPEYRPHYSEWYENGMTWLATSSGTLPNGQTVQAGDWILAIGDPNADYLYWFDIEWAVFPRESKITVEENATKLEISSNEIKAFNNGAPADLLLNSHSGTVKIGKDRLHIGGPTDSNHVGTLIAPGDRPYFQWRKTSGRDAYLGYASSSWFYFVVEHGLGMYLSAHADILMRSANVQVQGTGAETIVKVISPSTSATRTEIKPGSVQSFINDAGSPLELNPAGPGVTVGPKGSNVFHVGSVIETDGVSCRSGGPLLLSAGEASSYAAPGIEGATTEAVYIAAEGGVRAVRSPDNWASGWAGRDEIELFPDDWVNLPLGSGWANYGVPWATCQYRVDGKKIVLKGLAKVTSSSASATVFTLPSGKRPPKDNAQIYDQYCSGISTGFSGAGSTRLSIYDNGTGILSYFTAYVNGWLSLSGIEFYLD